MMRWLIFVHRWLGIGLGWLLVAWCLSGIVMMYVAYPGVSFEESVDSLPSLKLDDCCNFAIPAYYDDDSPVSELSIEMLGEYPVARLAGGFGRQDVINLHTGEFVTEISAADAQHIAAAMKAAMRIEGDLEYLGATVRDQWTVGYFDPHRRLHHFALNDDAGNEWYISNTTGELIQQSTWKERFWGWFGSVTHWLYPTLLRQNGPLWSQIVIWSTIVGMFLTVMGIYIGISRFKRRKGGHWSPYKGIACWHHYLGLVFGLLTLTWLLSGLFSMNPWGLLQGGSARAESQRVRDYTITWADAKSWIADLAEHEFSADVTRIESVPLAGRPYLMAYARGGGKTRLAAETLTGEPLKESELRSAAQRLLPDETIGSAELIDDEDAFYFNHHRQRAFPVYRVIIGDAENTRYYLDATNGQVVGKINSGRRWYRWLFEGLHRLDFTAAMRQRPVWDILMIVLLTGVTGVCITGTYMGVRYLFK